MVNSLGSYSKNKGSIPFLAKGPKSMIGYVEGCKSFDMGSSPILA